MLGLMLLLAAQADSPWQDFGVPAKDPVWFFAGSDGDYWIERGQVEKTATGKFIRFWMNGYHIRFKKVAYRSSLWRVTIDCQEAKFQSNAMTNYAADGSVSYTYDFPTTQPYYLIRPGTAYYEIMEKYCASGE